MHHIIGLVHVTGTVEAAMALSFCHIPVHALMSSCPCLYV